jgi:S-DNA-T family DNA segregation ATPase FtsK/SpoIIIE
MPRKKKKKEITIKSNETQITLGIFIGLIGLALILTPFFDEVVFTFFQTKLGYSSIVWGITLVYLSLHFISKNKKLYSHRVLIGLIIFALTTMIFLTFWIPKEKLVDTVITPDFSDYGGELGYFLHFKLDTILGRFLEFVILILAYIVGISLITGIRIVQMRDFLFESVSKVDKLKDKRIKVAEDKKDQLIRDNSGADEMLNKQENEELDSTGTDEEDDERVIGPDGVEGEAAISGAGQRDKSENDGSEDEPDISDVQKDFEIEEDEPAETADDSDESDEEKITRPQFTKWDYPKIRLLADVVKQPQNKEVLREKSDVIEKTLDSFGVEGRVKEIVVGPTVVQFALQIMVGTKVSKIKNLTNDLALALATSASSIRIEAPIPGTSLIGIEIPNPTPNFVFLKEMVSQLQANKDNYELPLILGKSVSGDFVIRDLTKLPHMLVAGATGTGKSVGINAMIMGMLMTMTPDEVKLILVDPKMVEMSPYNGIPHLLTPVITDMELVANALQWAVEEMHRRYRMLKSAGVRNIAEFNKKLGFTGLPYIVIVIDEMADLMLSSGIDVESKIVRLAQMSRAVGIHLILATQRPSVNVITGLIKANVPGRVAFSVATAIDSRVIIDQSGAEALIGKGDMLFKSPQDGRPIRIQGAYTDIKDIESVIDFIKSQVEDDVEYDEEILESSSESGSGAGGGDDEERDELFEEALELVIRADKGSASYLQRKLRVGYNRAARILDQLHEAGAVGPQQGSSPRDVLVSSKEEVLGGADGDDIED